jgi:hypothetical protein
MVWIGFKYIKRQTRHLALNIKRRSEMTKFTVELDLETIDNIVVEQLRNTWESLKDDLGAGRDVFVWGDQEADDVEIQKHIDAVEIVLKWYSTPDQMKEMGLKEDA